MTVGIIICICVVYTYSTFYVTRLRCVWYACMCVFLMNVFCGHAWTDQNYMQKLCVYCLGIWPHLVPLLSPTPSGHPGPGTSSRKPGTAIPECIQKRMAEDTCEEPRQGCSLFQGSAAVPAQPGRSCTKSGNTWEPTSMPGAVPQPLRLVALLSPRTSVTAI